MIRILYIGNNLSSGNPTTIRILSKLLKRSNFEVILFSNKQNKIWRLLDMCYGVIKYRKSNFLLIDTYSTSNFYYAFVCSQLALIFSLKYIPILHGGNLPMRLEKSSFLSNMIFKNSFVNVAPSAYLFDNFNKKGFNTIQISNALDLKLYPYKKREKFQPKLLWLRAFDEIYNPIMAIEVLKLLKETYPESTLCMIGADKDGSLKKVKSLSEKYDLYDAVEFTGYLSKWIEKSQNYDIFINTTNIDNTPVSVIEMMALGLPIVSTNVGGIPYLIEHKMDGLLVDRNDIEGMVTSILNLLSNSELTVKITRNARKKVEGFDIGVISKKWNDLLNENTV